MEPGTRFVGYKTVYEVEIEGRGGDSVHEERYEKEEDAVIAAALDRLEHGYRTVHEPRPVTVMEFSDGNYYDVHSMGVNSPPNDEERKKVLGGLSRAQKILLNMNDR